MERTREPRQLHQPFDPFTRVGVSCGLLLTLRAPYCFLRLDALELLAHGGMISWNVVTARRPLFRGEYPFFILRDVLMIGYTTRDRVDSRYSLGSRLSGTILGRRSEGKRVLGRRHRQRT
jgi:hypothetical protein